MTEYIDQLIDKEGRLTHPKTLVGAIKDAQEKLLINGLEQKNFKGLKDFSDGLQVGGKNVLTDSLFALDTCLDLHDVKKSGFYRYDHNTKNIPYMYQKEFMNGYFFSLFNDDDNGVVIFLGSLMYVEKYQGNWHHPFSPMPVVLWEGAAQSGDSLTLSDVLSNYSTFRVYVNIPGMSNHVKEVRLYGDNWIYATYEGLSVDGKTLHVDEVALKKADDRTLSYISETLLDVRSGTSKKMQDKSLVKIEGLRLT